MKLKLLMLSLSIVFIQQLVAQEKASTILKDAYKQAKIENKKVFVIFHASWCGWCKKMDNNMNHETCKEFFDKNYVVTHLVVYESKKNKHLENPGALDLIKQYIGGRENIGIPFWLVFNKNGKLLEDSIDPNGKNIGCPATQSEVAEFVNILRNTSDLSDEDLKIIAKKFLSKG